MPWELYASWGEFLASQGHALCLRWLLVLGELCLSRLPQHLNPRSSVGLLYLWSADSIRKGTSNGLEGALGKHQIPAGENAFPLNLTKVHPHCCSFHHFLESPKVPYPPSSQFHLPVPDSTMGRPCTTSETISYIHMLPAVPIISVFKGSRQLNCSKYHLCSTFHRAIPLIVTAFTNDRRPPILIRWYICPFCVKAGDSRSTWRVLIGTVGFSDAEPFQGMFSGCPRSPSYQAHYLQTQDSNYPFHGFLPIVINQIVVMPYQNSVAEHVFGTIGNP